MTHSRARAVAALVIAVEAAALLGLCVLYAVDLTRGEADNATRAVMSIVVMVVMALLLLAVAWGWRHGRDWPRTATIVWNALLLPVGLSLLQSHQGLWGVLLLLAGAAGLGAALLARPVDHPGH